MKKLLFIFFILYWAASSFGQSGQLIEKKALKFSIHQKKDTIDFIVVDTTLSKRKPIFLWCQGSLPIPLFCEIENYGYYFFGGGVSNFNYAEITKQYHLVIISMPKTPIIAKKENINKGFQYCPDPEQPYIFSKSYLEADYLDNYVSRAQAVIKYLKKQKWVSHERLIVAGHSQGTKVATKIALKEKGVTHLGMFAANPLGRIDQYIREARLNAQLGKISWEKADSLMNDYYDFYKTACNKDSILTDPSLKAWKTFSETYYDDWLSIDIPIYLAYGSEDRTSDLCDIVPLFFIDKGKDNLSIKRYKGLEHNFFELDKNGGPDIEKGHWTEVMSSFLQWVK